MKEQNEEESAPEQETPDPAVWPPPPTTPMRFTQRKRQSSIIPVVSLCQSGFGLVSIIIGCSGPSQAGLSGLPFMNAFEADEDMMLWLLLGVLLSLLGFTGSVFCWRSWPGKYRILLALLAGFWLFLRRNHY